MWICFLCTGDNRSPSLGTDRSSDLWLLLVVEIFRVQERYFIARLRTAANVHRLIALAFDILELL